jgi:hypothetical protein
MDATAGRPDHRIEILEAADEEGLGGGSIFLTAAVRHRLPTAGLIERVLDRTAEPLKEFKGRDADFRKEGIDVTGDEESDLHRARSFDRIPLRRQISDLSLVRLGGE